MMSRTFIAASLVAVALIVVTPTDPALHPGPAPAHRKPLFQGAQIDESTLALFLRACQDCHSENTQWPWYSHIPPASWLLERDVKDARRQVNFSNWDSYNPQEKEDLLTRIASAARTGEMPLARYMFLHREAVLTSQERQQIYEWSRAEKKRLRAAGGKKLSFDIDASSGLLPHTQQLSSQRLKSALKNDQRTSHHSAAHFRNRNHTD